MIAIAEMCQKCGKGFAYQDGECIGCYSLSVLARVLADTYPPGGCSNCGADEVFCGGRCHDCYRYKLRRKVERPKIYWEASE